MPDEKEMLEYLKEHQFWKTGRPLQRVTTQNMYEGSHTMDWVGEPTSVSTGNVMGIAYTASVGAPATSYQANAVEDLRKRLTK